MKKLLALSVALLSVSLYGADKSAPKLDSKNGLPIVEGKPIWSRSGLEGIAKKGISVYVHDWSNSDKTFDKEAIKNQVELRLKLAGVKILGGGVPQLEIDAQPSVKQDGEYVEYRLGVRVVRAVTFDANGKTYSTAGIAWGTGLHFAAQAQFLPTSKLREGINKHMDKFLLAYLKANPKKKEKE